jgi:hypothetical protein
MDKDKIKQIILKEISKTERLVSDYREMSQPVEPDNAIGRISRMDAINSFAPTGRRETQEPEQGFIEDRHQRFWDLSKMRKGDSYPPDYDKTRKPVVRQLCPIDGTIHIFVMQSQNVTIVNHSYCSRNGYWLS